MFKKRSFAWVVSVVVLITCTVSLRSEDVYEEEQWKNGYFGISTYGGPGSGGYYQMNVNLHNGGVNLHIPLISLPGRAGHDLSIVASYNSKQIVRQYDPYMYDGIEYGPGHQAHFYHQGPTMGRWMINVWPTLQIEGDVYYFTTPDGAVHKLSKYSYPRYIAEDGSDIAYDPTTLKVSYPNGEFFDFSQYDTQHVIHHVDRNGNQISYHFEDFAHYLDYRPFKIVDTLGREVLLNYEYIHSTEISEMVVKNHAGQDLTYSFEYDTKLYWPTIGDWSYYLRGFSDHPFFHYGCRGYATMEGEQVKVLTSITLPNNTAYQFDYLEERLKYNTSEYYWVSTFQMTEMILPTGAELDFDYTVPSPDPPYCGTPPCSWDYPEYSHPYYDQKINQYLSRIAIDPVDGEILMTDYAYETDTDGYVTTTTEFRPDGSKRVVDWEPPGTADEFLRDEESIYDVDGTTLLRTTQTGWTDTSYGKRSDFLGIWNYSNGMGYLRIERIENAYL
jgi:hypothetical protein